MGGISVLVLFATMGALAIAFLAAAVLFLAATIVSVVFAARTKKRHAQGKRLKGLIAIPIALYAVSVPVLLFFSITVIIPACHDSATTDYFDCSNAITRHDSASLERALDAPELQLPDDGPGHIEASSRLASRTATFDASRRYSRMRGKKGVRLI